MPFQEQYSTFDVFKNAVLEKFPYAGEEYQWSVGGMSGGNCWGGEPTYSSYAEDGPDDTELDGILELVAPRITFLQYKRLGDVYDRRDKTNYEYYGNYTYYKIKSLNLRKLYSKLVEIL